MSRKKSLSFAQLLRRAISGLFGNKTNSRAEHNTKRHLRFESLECRAVMHGDLAGVTGIVSLGGAPVVGASVELFQDDGDAIFEPGAGDTQVGVAVLTDANGRYLFDRMGDGDYWVRQPAQTVGAIDLGLAVSSLINVSHAESEGILDNSLDLFDDSPAQSVQAADVVGTIAASAADNVNVLGFERDLIAELTSGAAGEFVQLDSQQNRLLITSTTNAQGTFTVVYDGDDDDGDTLNPVGLGGHDLTNAGQATAIKVRIRADQLGANLRLRVFTDATHFSDSQPLNFSIPGTNVDTDAIFYFEDFVAGAGAAGAANAANVGALQMQIITTTDATNGRVTLLGTFRPTLETQDFDNEADLSLTKDVDNPTPNVGDTITFTLTVANGGTAGATNVVVHDLLPVGFTNIQSTPSQGTYDAQTGDWTVGTVAVGVNATLTITATVATPGAKINDAEITQADQVDPDSTPGNNVPAEDDQDSVTVTPQSSDLSLTVDVDDATPLAGQSVVFTVTLNNGGPDAATGVVVRDLLPAGLTFVSSTPSQGNYVSGTGLWTVGTVNSGGTATLTITATVGTSGAKTNTAEITDADQNDPDSTPNNNAGAEDDQDSVTVTPEVADLSLTKDVDDATPTVGQSVIFTLTVANGGPDAATGVVIEDLLPAGMTFVSSTPSQGSYVEGTGIWTVGTIASAGNATLTITATNTTGAVKTNTAEVTDVDQFDSDSTPDNSIGTEDDQDSVTITPDVIDLALTKTVDDNTLNLNQQVVFTITVTNTGTIGATGVVVDDLLPAGLTFVSSNPSQGSYVSGTGVWTVGAIGIGGQATLAITATATGNGAVTNTAEVTAAAETDRDSTPDNQNAQEDDQASSQVTISQNIDLSLTKIVDDASPTNGQNITFTLTVSNAGPDNATGVVVEDLLPAGLTFVSSTPSQGSYVSGTGIWTVGGINSGANATLQIVATVTTIGAKTNTAEVVDADQTDTDSTPDNNVGTEDDQASVTVTPEVADLSIQKTVDDNTPDKNQNVVFTITVSNGGPQAATGVQVTDLLPAGLTFVSSTPSQGSYVSGTGIWTVGTINSGANATLTITATTATIGAKTNTAEITDVDQFDSDSTPNNQVGTEDDQASVVVTPNVADLSITKTVDDNTPNRNQNVTFTITVTNGGPIGATGVTVTDLLPAGLTFVSATPSVGTYSNTTGVWTVGSVASGANATLSIVATTAAIGAKTNTAEITASNQFDSDSTPGNNVGTEDDQASVMVTPAIADLSLIKTVNLPNQQVGQNVIFTLTLSNAGPDAATGVTATDLLPAGLTFVSSTPSQGTYSSTTGLWTVGTINSGANATLTITATVNGLGALANSAQVTASDQFDSDSTPGNSVSTEDDQSSISVTPPARFSKRMFLARPLP